METYKRIPVFFGLRIYAMSSMLYLLLVLPFAGFLVLQNLPALIERSEGIINQVKSEENTPSPPTQEIITKPADDKNLFKVKYEDQNLSDAQNELLNRSFNFLFNALIISFLIGFIFNYPFKRYFRRKRKSKAISERLFSFCKKYILISPWINAGILGGAYLATLIFMVVITFSMHTGTEGEFPMFNRFFLISFFSALLTILFVYFWEKHRVHTKYLDHLYSKEELRRRVFKFAKGKIKNRFWISSAMTTLLPLSIVIVYLIMSLTRIGELKLEQLSEDQIAILFGRYSNMMKMIIENPNASGNMSNLTFVNVMDGLIMFFGIGFGILVSFIYLIMFVKWTTLDIVFPVKELIYNMQRTGEGQGVNYTIVRNNDEIGELAEGYNEMAQRIEHYIANISTMNEAYFRFVPKQFLDILGKESITEIKLGDQIQKEMSVLFTDIRDFTALSEAMSPKETFDFLNEYLSQMEPVIARNHGFIDKYIGDSIMALFMGDVENAVDAAIEMRAALSDFNLKRKLEGKKSTNSGIGIHTGNLMLGIVGGYGRMDGTVVSDAVNLASRIEGLTKMYGTSIIISQDTLIKLQDPSRYNYRFLDVVKVKGKKEAVYIFEILDGEPADIKKLKIETKHDFGKALQFYKSKNFDAALDIFKTIHAVNPADQAAQLYISRCKNIIDFGIPEDWDGVEILKDKY
ncbi:MAG TPA: adenylate/guanylate cyclase domain-containing protein [Bacteroidales bacterium]|nr:adenylate/guanylate cyclase domain-containing protein [Bacteroidales bacterium]